jgi:hypothetical protein
MLQSASPCILICSEWGKRAKRAQQVQKANFGVVIKGGKEGIYEKLENAWKERQSERYARILGIVFMGTALSALSQGNFSPTKLIQGFQTKNWPM